MLELPDRLKKILIDYAIAQSPNEACGYILLVGENLHFFPCENIHQDPKNNFAISASNYAFCESIGEIKALFHSHTDATIHNGKLGFSEADKAVLEREEITGVLLALPHHHFSIYNPCGWKPPLIGRSYCYGIFDCFSLIRDALRDEFGIEINDYDRSHIYEWNENDWNRFEENYHSEGFEAIEPDSPLQLGDVILFRIEKTIATHAAIVWNQDSEKIYFLHQLIDRPSTVEEYSDRWKKRTVKVIRHRSKKRPL